MQIKLLRDVIGKISGKNSIELADILSNKKNVNEFLIAKKLKLTINQTRRILYRLSDFGLVSFIRKKDKRKGWYTYFWTLNIGRALKILHKELNEEINQLEHQLKSRQVKRFYVCKTCGNEVNEETALLNDFMCKECGMVYELNESKKVINELNSRIAFLKKEKEDTEREIKIIEEKEEKAKKRREKKVANEKKAMRAKRALERKKLREKEKRKAEKNKKRKSKQSSKKKTKKKQVREKKAKKKPIKKKSAKKKKEKKKVVRKKK